MVKLLAGQTNIRDIAVLADLTALEVVDLFARIDGGESA